MKTSCPQRTLGRTVDAALGVVVAVTLLSFATAATSFGATPSAAPAPTPTLAEAPVDPATAAELEDALGMTTPSRDTYQIIIARNPFDLRPPPEPEPEKVEEEEPEVEPSDLKLTGITTLLGSKRAMFVLQEKGKEEVVSDLVAEGQKDTFIPNLEVVQIDEIAGKVRVLLAGEPMMLDFVNNGIPPEVAHPPAKPGARGPAKPGVRTVATTTRSTATRPGGTTAGRRTASSYTRSSGLNRIPTRQTRMAPRSSNAYGRPTDAPRVSPQDQALTMRAQQEMARQAGVVLPPVPPMPGGPPGMTDVPPAP